MIERFFSESTIILNQDPAQNVVFVVIVFVAALAIFVKFMQKVY